MKQFTVSQAFSEAPPRSAAVLCKKGPSGSTDIITTEWFTWLNLKHQPMISFSMPRSASLGLNLEVDEEFFLAFPPRDEAVRFAAGVRTAEQGKEKQLPDGVQVMEVPGVPVLVPQRSKVILRCTLAGSYNFPFKKVKIFNCNLEDAQGEIESELEP